MNYNIEKDERQYEFFIKREENKPIYVYRQSAGQRKEGICEVLEMDDWGELHWEQYSCAPQGERTDKMLYWIVQEMPEPVFFTAQREGDLVCDDFLGSISPYEANDSNRIGYRPVGIFLYNSMPLISPTHVDMGIELVDRILKTAVGESFEDGDLTIEVITKDKAKRIFEQQS